MFSADMPGNYVVGATAEKVSKNKNTYCIYIYYFVQRRHAGYYIVGATAEKVLKNKIHHKGLVNHILVNHVRCPGNFRN
jgi:hypothetical protein